MMSIGQITFLFVLYYTSLAILLSAVSIRLFRRWRDRNNVVDPNAYVNLSYVLSNNESDISVDDIEEKHIYMHRDVYDLLQTFLLCNANLIDISELYGKSTNLLLKSTLYGITEVNVIELYDVIIESSKKLNVMIDVETGVISNIYRTVVDISTSDYIMIDAPTVVDYINMITTAHNIYQNITKDEFIVMNVVSDIDEDTYLSIRQSFDSYYRLCRYVDHAAVLLNNHIYIKVS